MTVMKNLSLLLIFLCWSLGAFSQESNKGLLIKKWTVKAIEEFGVEYQIDEESEHVKDWLIFTKEGIFSGLIENKQVEGTWSIKSGKTYMTANKTKSIKKINWIKVDALTETNITFTYQSENLIKTTLIFIPEDKE